ncbi:sulfatase-like hydrolase/transferase [Microbulbifer elongatus]|uniref:sulfatase-like hydrolase/transferase n=1 Tax=Microbulbifer elongatus TaxID=86173 RepID=UPI001E2AD1A0|nr:sulfatase-like hydrolase/transferase [Microbulbifer elongatus]
MANQHRLWTTAILCFVAVVLTALLAPESRAGTERPNIVLITADDLGFDDLSLHGNPVIETPSLDQLAAESVQFSDFTVTPVCSTTRASLLTGRHHYKAGVSGVHGGRDYMSRDETLISEVLKERGYATGLWGKWHLGKTRGYLPWERGFDDTYYAELYVHDNSFGYRQGERVEHDTWVSEVVTDYAIDFIERNREQPFFAYLSYLAPHEPWQAPEQFVQPYREKGQRDAIANLYGMVSEMDFHIGRLLQYLDDSGLAENTLVIFMSDNGPWYGSSNAGPMLRNEWRQRNPNKSLGQKGRNWQNGVKSPLFVHWPARFAPATSNAFVHVTDIFPLLMEVTGGAAELEKPLDGESFLAALEGNVKYQRQKPFLIGSHDLVSHKKHFNEWTPVDAAARAQMPFESQMLALRQGPYKLILNPILDEPDYPEPVDGYLLFDLQKDPGERENILRERPQLASELKRTMRELYQEIMIDADSLRTPVYPVHGPVDVINAFGPASTGGEVVSGPHNLKGFSEPGDFSEYRLHVEAAGRYRLFLDKSGFQGAGLRFSVSLAGQQVPLLLEEKAIQQIGEFELPAGEAFLRFELQGNESMTPWARFDSFRRLYLVSVEVKAPESQIMQLEAVTPD